MTIQQLKIQGIDPNTILFLSPQEHLPHQIRSMHGRGTIINDRRYSLALESLENESRSTGRPIEELIEFYS